MKTALFLCCALFAACSASRMMRAMTNKPGACPKPSGMAGICVFDPNVNCLYDSECDGDKKCCSEGCGKVCKDPVQLAHAGECPAPTSEIGICVLLPNSCSTDGDCASTEKCCSEGCNRICKKAVNPVVG
ncbi:antileukoproteinase-like [Babylonia areolata]|uniref:antileukoproteinase-like n=1 Tax=Babylonia areolata TaxID=304850 RepID=UPI003FD3DB7F